jgi:hypothetical protein
MPLSDKYQTILTTGTTPGASKRRAAYIDAMRTHTFVASYNY